MVKNLPAMQETWVQIPWRGEWQQTSIFCLENSMDRGAWWGPWGRKELVQLSNYHFLSSN